MGRYEDNIILRDNCVRSVTGVLVSVRTPVTVHIVTIESINYMKSIWICIVVWRHFPCAAQGSRWTLQAMLMNGRLDFLDWTIKPDQMQTLVPLFGLTFLVLFDVALYPLLAKVGVRKPLQKLTLSGVLAVTAFVIAALLQFKIFVRRASDYFFNSHTSYILNSF